MFTILGVLIAAIVIWGAVKVFTDQLDGASGHAHRDHWRR